MPESLSESQVLGLLHAELCHSAFSIMAKRRKHYRLRYHGTDIRIELWHTFIGRLRQFYSELQWHWQWHRWHYWQKFKKQWTDNTNCQPAVPVVHRFTRGPSGLQQSHPKTIKTLPHLAFWLQDKEDKLHPWAD